MTRRRNSSSKHSKENAPIGDFGQAFPRETDLQAKKWAKLLEKARKTGVVIQFPGGQR